MSESETDWKTGGFLPDAWKKSILIISNQQKKRGDFNTCVRQGASFLMHRAQQNEAISILRT